MNSPALIDTNVGGSERKCNSLKDLETTEQGLETIGFLANGTPRQKRCRHIEESDYHSLEKQPWRRLERENWIFSTKKNNTNESLLIAEADPRGNIRPKFRSDHPTPLGSTRRTALYGVACRDSLSLPLFYETSGKFAYSDLGICRFNEEPY